jgi:leucyl-tRNA synthetase
VEKKLLRQWFLNIRKYADEMLDDLNHLNLWNETVKESQRGWIGKSHGAKINFTIDNLGYQMPLTIFTTRPDTLFGVTFIAISYDNPIVE